MKQTLLMLLCCLAVGLMPCHADDKPTADTYSFPMKPGDETWKTYETAKDLKDALQIPSDVISSISTANLLDLCISYPYNIDMLSTDNAENGFRLLCSEFNGYAELLTRNDLGSALISRCEAIPSEIDLIPSMDEDDVDELSLKYYVMYYIMGLDQVVSGFDELQLETYYDAINANLDIMAQYPDVFGISYQQCLRLSPLRYNVPQYTYTTIQTPNGYTVVAGKLIESTELSNSDKKDLKKRVETQYPGAVVLSEATGKYNCHAYAWHHKEVPTSDAVWINNPYMYWTTGCYYEVPVEEAEIVTYNYNGGITHSAVRISDNEYISKWGPWPLVRHSPTNVPNSYEDGYYGVVYKGYKRLKTTMAGNGLIKTSSTFSVGQIPSCYTVDWTLSDDYYSRNCMTVNNDGTCTITRTDANDIYDATLGATIKYNGYNVYKFTKQVYAYKDFRGTYDSAGSYNVSLTHPYIINAILGENVIVKSPSLYGAKVTYEGDITPRYFYVYNEYAAVGGVDRGVISTALSSTGTALVMHVVTTEDERYDLIIIARLRSGSISSSFENNFLSIRYGQDSDTHADYSEHLSAEATADAPMSVEIRDLLTNTKVYETKSTDHEISVFTGEWKPGVYIVTAKADNEVMTKKILIK